MTTKAPHLINEAKSGNGVDFRRDSNPDQADTLLNEATQLAKAGKRKEAINLFRHAIRIHPDHAQANHNLGVALSEEKDFQQALACIRAAIRIQPDYAEAHYNLGNTLGEVGRVEEAVAAFKSAIRHRPDYVDAFNNLGLTLVRLGRVDEAIVFHRQAVRLRPKSSEGLNNLGLVYASQGDFAKAEACYEQALKINPTYSEAHTNLGSAFKEQGRLDEAIACYDMALTYEPESVTTHWNRSLAWLQMGNYEQGWPEYEWRWKRKETKASQFPQPRWDGSPLDGRSILLHTEQGVGDMIQFLRYAPLVNERGGKVTVSVPPGLVPLFSTCPGIEKVVPENQELPPCDFYAPLMSLPGIFGTNVSTVPANVPYLHPEPERLDKWRERIRDVAGLKVGIVWQGNPRHKWDRHRSFPLVLLEPIARVSGVSLISMQKETGAEQVDLLDARFPILDLGPELESFTDTAAVLKCLDLVICCDTAVAHLAGALAVPVWVALSTIVDWRWLLNREDSPWYPTMRLFRQEQQGDWKPVVERIASELSALVNRFESGDALLRPLGRDFDLASAMESAERHRQNRDFSKAERLFRQLLGRDPFNADAAFQLAVTYQAQGKIPEALTYLGQALRIRPKFAEARHARALLFASKGDLSEAIEELNQALALKSDDAEIHHNLGVTLARAKRLNEAITAFREAIRIKPDYTEALSNLARACEESENLEGATDAYQELLCLRPDDATIHNSLGVLFVKRSRLPEAAEEFRNAIDLAPKMAVYRNNLGAALAELGRPADALEQFNAALEINPEHVDAHKNRGMSLLHLGDFENGWKEYEWRWKGSDFANIPLRKPAWDGSPLEGRRILLYCEQGFGDTLQFVRFAPLVKAHGGTVYLECPRDLKRLLATCDGIEHIRAPSDSPPEVDVYSPLLSLPRILNTTLPTIPTKNPYLSADPTLTQWWEKELRQYSGFRIGIVWQGNPRKDQPQCRVTDKRRSAPLASFEPLAEIPGVKLFSLQKGFGTEQLVEFKYRSNVVDLGDKLDDFMVTAAVMMNMDLIITVDSSPTHLAGALGRPVWTAVAHASCWRWLLDREDSPWYPTMRLFRQPRAGDWKTVFERMSETLRHLVTIRNT